jgi:16S rRNA (cytosine1402-N4)-methyltransferase
MYTYHLPVLLKASVDALVTDPGGIYADATFGGGGHTREILSRLNTSGRLISFDKDTDALANAPDDKRFTLVNHNFRFMRQFLQYINATPADGILADLGISSHQIDEGSRGFAHRLDGPLDMRMDQSAAISAETVVNEYEQKDLEKIFRTWGEIPNAGKLAAIICNRRKGERINSSKQFVDAIAACTPRNTPAKYLSQVYQALRIEVNGEMRDLETLLNDAAEMIKPGGRLVIISYHSLEDRLVKNYMLTGNTEGKKISDFYGNTEKPFAQIQSKPTVPDDEENATNKRARSAKMRIGIRL